MQHGDSGYKLVPIPRTSAKFEGFLSKFGLHADDLRRSVEFSSLAFLGLQRFEFIREATSSEPIVVASQPTHNEAPAVNPDVKAAEDRTKITQALHALQRAYGSRLVIVYLPIIGMRASGEPSPNESHFLNQCGQDGIACFSLRPAMV